MIDAERWVLAEAWIASGLRMRWARSYEYQGLQGITMQGERSDFWYEGHGTWVMLPRNELQRNTEAPLMSPADMRHELAHWLVSSEEQRGKANFGLGATDRDAEDHALQAERVISAVVAAAARIATMALVRP